MKAINKLKKYSPCQEAVNWLGDKDLKEAWDTCERGDWMLWAYNKLYPNNLRQITLAKGHISNAVRHLMKDERSIAAVDAAVDFGNGLIDADRLNATVSDYAVANYATYATYAAYAAYAAHAAAATYAATTAAATYAAYAAASVHAAHAAADAADAAADAARKSSLLQSANICRQYLTIGE